MNRGELVFAVSREIGLSDRVGSDELTLLQKWANEAVIDVLKKTHCHVELGDFTTIVGTRDYRTDSNILAVKERTVEASNSGKLTLVTADEILDRRRSASTATGIKHFAVEGDLLMLWPTPAAIETIRFLYVAKPTPMTADANDPSSTTYGGIPTELHDALEFYMCWRAAKYDNSSTPLKPTEYLQLYNDKINQTTAETRKKKGRTLPTARIGYPGTYGYAKRNDVYPGQV